jgi:dephospho-CoA kinase
VSDYFVSKLGYQFLRFGQITLDEVKRRGLELNEANEKVIREGFRKEYGMAAFAILNLEKLDKLVKIGNVVGDGLYSYEEYEVLKEHFGDRVVIIAVWAPPKLRYERISTRVMTKKDADMRHRPFTKDEAKSRDEAELKNLNKGATLAMADYTILNDKDMDYLLNQVNEVADKISKA